MAYDPTDDLNRIPAPGSSSESDADLAQIPAPTAAPEPPKQTFGDLGKRFAAGLADTFLTAPGAITESLGGSGIARRSGQELSKRITDTLSPQAQALDQNALFGEDWSVHPQWGQKIAAGVAQSAPSLIQAFALGRQLQAPLTQAGVAEKVAAGMGRIGVPAGAAKYVGQAAEALPFSAIEGAASGGQSAADVIRQVEEAPIEQLMTVPRFNELFAATNPALSPEERAAAVRAQMAVEAGRSAGLKTGAWTGGVGFLTQGGVLGPIARRLSGKGVGEGFFREAIKGGLREAGQETPQSAGEQYFSNVGRRDYVDPTQDPWQNVGQAGAEGGVIGFALGGGADAATYRPRPRDEQPHGAAPPGTAPVAPPGAPPVNPPVGPNAGPISRAVQVGQQSGAIPTNAIGGPVDTPGNEEVTQPPGSMGKSLLGVAPSEASSDEKTSALSAIADIAAKVPVDAPLAPDSPVGQAMAGAIERATAAGATQEDLLAAAAGRVPPPDIRPSPKEVKAATKELDAAIDRVGKLTEKIARANAAADKARERGDEETAGNAESLAATLRDRLEAARGQLESLQGAQRAGTGSGPVPGTDVGTGVLPADGRPRGGGDQPGRTDAGGSVAAAGVPAGRPAGEGAGLAAAAVPSGDARGARPVVLQNRDRSSAASVAQMASIASNPDPRRLSFSRDFGTGAPVVFANADAAAIPETQLGAEGEVVDAAGKTIPVRYAVVEAAEVVASNRADGTPNDLYADADTPGLIRAVAGNGRMAGLQEAFNRGTAAGYVEGIAADARLHGVDPEVIRGMQNPVLVRVMRSDDVTPDIGDRSNVSGISQLDPVEQARTDVARVNLDGLEFGEDGGPAVEAVRRFIRAMPDSEQSGLMDQSGAPGRQAVDRLMAAAFAKAYESDDLVRLYAQATDPEARNVISALAQAAGPMARLAGAGDLDIRPAVIEAAQSAVNASRRGVSLSKFSQQRDFDVTPEAWRVVEHFVANARSAKRMAEGLRSLAEAAYSEAQKGDVDMFGTVPKRTGSQIINEAFDGQQREGDANADAIAGRPRLDEEGAGGPGGRQDERTPANDPGQPQDADRPADGQAGDFDLVAPTREDILRQQEAAERAAQGEQTEDEAQARLDAEREAADQVGFLRPPPSGTEQRDTTGDMLGGPTADDVLAQRERERRNAPEAGGMFAAPVDEAAAQAATSPKNDTPEPTEAQKDAGNYKKGHVRIAGLDITIENEAGTHRRPEWPALPAHYGYLKRTEGADGDQVDVFVKPGAPEDFAGDVFVIDQMVGGKFDEHKVMLGYPNQPAAAKAYRDAYTKDWKGLGAIRRMTLDEFKTWLADGDTTVPAAQPAEAALTEKKVEGEPTATQAQAEKSAKRTRPKGRIEFANPVVGPSGAKLTGYQWVWQYEESVDERGEERIRRISDWDKAELNAQTNRMVVHQFDVVLPDGSGQLVSAETAIKLLGFGDLQGKSQFKSVESEAKTLARTQMVLTGAEQESARWKADWDAVQKMTPPQPESDSQRPTPGGRGLWWSMGDASIRQIIDGPLTQSTREGLVSQWRDNRMVEKGWKPGDGQKLADTVSDLKKRIKVAEKRIQAITKAASTEHDIPAFETYDDALDWVNKQAEPFASRKQFEATNLYRAAYPQIKALYDRMQARSAAAQMQTMTDAGIKVGDRVQFTVPGFLLAAGRTYTGTVIDSGGRPVVKIDGRMEFASRGGRTESRTQVAWDSRWTKAAAQAEKQGTLVSSANAALKGKKDAAAIARDIAKERPFDDAMQVRAAAREAIREQLGQKALDDMGQGSMMTSDELTQAVHDGQYEGIAAIGRSMPVPVTESQIGAELSDRAFAGTSHSPERRGQSARREYVIRMVEAWTEAKQAAGDDAEALARITDEFERLRDGYLSRYRAYLGAHSNVQSSMIAGPARFPVERNRKRSETADKRAEDANEFLRKGIERLKKAARAPIDQSPASEVERIRKSLAERERAQEQMKAVNAALRKGDDAVLREMGFTDEAIAQFKKPDFAGRTGFPSYRLTNNQAEIRRLRELLEQAEGRVEAAAKGPTSEIVNGVRIEEDAQANRIRLIFEGKPDEATRTALKAAGFRWAPSVGAWQRQLTGNARAAARSIVGRLTAGEPQAQYSVHEEAPQAQLDLPLAPRDDTVAGQSAPGRRVSNRARASAAVRLETTPDPAGVYHARTDLVAERHHTLPVDRVTTPQEAALALASVADYAVEHLHGLVTDKDGKPLALVGMFKGGLTSSSVYPDTLANEAFRIKGAANLWVTHNHPSGVADFSYADRNLIRAMLGLFQDTGITLHGMFAQTYTNASRSPGAWVFTQDGQQDERGQVTPADIRAAAKSTTIPVVERVITKFDPAVAISDPKTGIAAATSIQQALGAKQPFVMFLSAQNAVVGAYPLNAAEIDVLRKGERAANLFRAVSTANAGKAIIVDPTHMIPRKDIENVGGALAAAGASTLDYLRPSSGRGLLMSEASAGTWNAPGPIFFSRRNGSPHPTDAGRGTTGQSVAAVTRIADAVRAAWANGPEVVVLGSINEAPADVRALDSASRSKGAGRTEGFWHEGKVYLVADALPTAADVVRVLAHETLGHYGLRGVFGDRLGAILAQIVRARPADVVAKLRDYGLENTAENRLIAAEEVLAVMAQAQPEAGFVKVAVAMIRNWLRRLGLNLRMSDNDIIVNFILPARQFVERGERGRAGGAAARSGGAPIFYSELVRQIDAINARAQPAQSWVQQIDSLTKKGVKPDEIEWSGIKEWLALQQGKVTKDAILEYLAGNGVRVEETILGDPETEDALLEREARRLMREDGIENPTDEQVAEFIGEHGYDIDNVRDWQFVGQTKFGAYRVPGQAENYRELLLTLPMSDKFDPAKVAIERRRQSATQGSLVISYDGKQLGTWADKIELNPQTKQYEGMTDEQAIGIVRRRFNGDPSLRIEPLHSGFRSGHWDQPNVLAHIRFDERTDADGKRVLFINEIQSDWAQVARKTGFKSKGKIEVRRAENFGADDRDRYSVLVDGRIVGSVRAHTEAEALEIARARPDLRPPLAPFVSKTDAYVALGIKRIIRYAVDNGFDRVALVNGEQAAAMFDLSQHVKRIYYSRTANGYVLSADGRNGEVFGRTSYAPEELDNVVGKEIAQKIINGEGRADEDGGGRVLEGIDLKVGGAGMHGFYDKIVPTVLKDVLKKVGGRLATVTLPGTESRDALAAKVYGAGETYRNLPSESKRRIDAMFDDRKHEQLGFDITPELRELAAGPLPMFSRRPSVQSVQRAVGQAAQAIKGETLKSTWQQVVNAWKDKKPLALQLLGRRQLADIYGKMLPEIVDYSHRMQQYDADKNESAASADEIVNDWRKLPDADALADVMHGATLARFDPAQGEVKDMTAEMSAILGAYQALTPEAKAIYARAKRAYASHWALVKQAISERIERAHIAENERRELMEMYRDHFLQPIEGVYFPLARFGDYIITAKDAQGQKVVVFAETLNEAQREQTRMKGELNDVSKITKRKEYNASQDAVSKEFVRKLFDAIDETAVDGNEADMLKDSINQLYLTSLPDVSWAKHGIHRKGTPGYNKDARRAFAASMFHGGYHLAKLRHADVLQDYLRAAQERIDAEAGNEQFDSVTAQQVMDEMVKRHDFTMNPDNNALANRLTALGFIWHLGLSPASAIVNLSQTALVAYPIIAARFGHGKTAIALAKASKEAMQARNDLRGRYAGDEAGALDRAIREGLIDITQAHDLAGIAEGRDSQLQGAFSPVMRAASWMFHQAEKFNRQATFMAAYRLARATGENPEVAYETARDLTYKGHFDYASSNRARVMMGPAARVLLLFKQYGQNMIYTLGRNALLWAKGDREAKRALSGILVAHGLTAGMLGLPFAPVLLGLASIIGGSDDEPWDAEVALRNYLADSFLGKTGGEMLARGVFRGFFPGDISGRVGLDSLLIRDIDLTLEPNQVWREILEAALGPVIGIGVNASRGAADLARGDLMLGIQGMLPKAIADGVKTIRYATEGVKDRTGIEVLDEVTARDLVAQTLGFSPGRVREAYDARRAVYGQKRKLDDRRDELLSAFSKSVIAQDHETRLKTLQEIQHFNQINPTMAITSQSMLRSIQNRMRRQAEAKDGIYLPRKQRDLAELGRFANTR